MAPSSLISPELFVQHATRLRAKKLEQLASSVKQDLRIRPVTPPPARPAAARSELSAVLRQFRGRLR